MNKHEVDIAAGAMPWLRNLTIRTRSYLLAVTGMLTLLVIASGLSTHALQQSTDLALAERLSMAQWVAQHRRSRGGGAPFARTRRGSGRF